MKEKPENRRLILRIINVIANIIYVPLLIFLSVVTIRLTYQTITEPEKIPDIFGYKLFMIFDENMDDNVEYGDLVFTKNINTDELKIDNVIAFRNKVNAITIHKIVDINEKIETNTETDEKKTVKIFTMKTLENEVNDNKSVQEEKIEGLLVKRIPKIGLVIYFIQQPLVMFGICFVIVFIGLICYLIARMLDKKDELKQDKKVENNKISQKI